MSIELKPFRHEAHFDAGGFPMHLVMDFAAVDRLEALLRRSFQDLLGMLASSTAMAIKFIWAVTREHNPELTMDEIAGVMFSPAYGEALMVTLGDLIKRSFPGAFSMPIKAPKAARKRSR